jgi:hypothetical protein
VDAILVDDDKVAVTGHRPIAALAGGVPELLQRVLFEVSTCPFLKKKKLSPHATTIKQQLT